MRSCRLITILLFLHIFEISHNKTLKIIMINTLKDLVDKLDNMHEQMGNFGRERNSESNENGRTKKHYIRAEEFL